ncbi:hypothetical protein Sjap_026028 [Stephania japonica]|uniref:Uncharacterized protein n=1 Tax=Stephania japonica TaxID=461633 RepID=A0AAP0HI40_9MAGN
MRHTTTHPFCGSGDWPPAMSSRLSEMLALTYGRRDQRWLMRSLVKQVTHSDWNESGQCTPLIYLATPGQAGPPAKFKHIIKQRKRNLLGFP